MYGLQFGPFTYFCNKEKSSIKLNPIITYSNAHVI